MNVDFVNPFLSSMLNVISTMAKMDLYPDKPRLKTNEVAEGDISGVISMMSSQAKGSLSITFEASLALAAMRGMLGESPKEVNDDVSDLVGEITNMVTGGAKQLLEEKGYDFDMATPVVVSGKNHTIRHKSKAPIIIIPFTSAQGNAFIEFSFDK